MVSRRYLLLTAVLFGLAAGAVAIARSPAAQEPLSEDQVLGHSLALVFANDATAHSALAALAAHGDPALAPTLITAMRFSPVPGSETSAVLSALTGETEPSGWFDWMLWMEGATDHPVHPTYPEFQRELYARIDPRFTEFLPAGVSHEIRLEEIVWGGVRVDGIPALTNPDFTSADAAGWLNGDDLVFGVEINGDARAYPLRILDWHEMFNDVVGGVPVSLAYCTLCGAGILFDTRVERYDEPLVFGSSGFLFRSNKLMYDTRTRSLWNQFTGEPVVGPLVASGIRLDILPVAITSWDRWRERHPDTRVLSLDTGHSRDYRSGAAYGEYFASPNLMFPALVADGALAAKDFVFGIRTAGGAKAWPLEAFEGGAVVNDRVGFTDVVLVGDAASRTVRAYARDGIAFAATGDDLARLAGDGTIWTVAEDALMADDGRRLARQAGHVAYWFAWAGYLDDTAVFAPGE